MELFVQLLLILRAFSLFDAFRFLRHFSQQEFEVVLRLLEVNECILLLRDMTFLDIAGLLENASKARKAQFIVLLEVNIGWNFAVRCLNDSCFWAVDHVAIACLVGIIRVVAGPWEEACLRTEFLYNLFGISIFNLMHFKKLD